MFATADSAAVNGVGEKYASGDTDGCGLGNSARLESGLYCSRYSKCVASSNQLSPVWHLNA
jgi:hypothetical protein